MVFETKKNDLFDENDLKSLNNFFEVPENFVQKIKIQEVDKSFANLILTKISLANIKVRNS